MLFQDQVFQEIANLLGVEDATTSTPEWFQKRMPPIKQVFHNMNAKEKADLDEEQEKMMQEGYPELTRQR
jgi:hypothetical protein